MNLFSFLPYILLSILLISTSCGVANNKPVEAGNLGLGQELSGASNLTGEKKETALRICYAYRSKRVGLRANYLNQDFSFAIQNSPCSDDSSNKSISATLKEVFLSQPMIFDSSERSMTWFNTINTDEDGDIASLCENLMKGQTVSNSISSGGGVLKLADFSVNTDNDHYTVLEGIQNAEGKYSVTKRTVYYVQTTNQSSPQVGDDYQISHQEVCPEGSANDNLTVEQSTSSYP